MDVGEPDERGPDREAGESGPTRCELCGGRTVERHCKIVCLRCGFKRDCSDP